MNGPDGGRPAGRSRALLAPGRLVRYGVAGGASALTHLGVLAVSVEWLGLRPLVGSTVGFAASVAVSYLLQRLWVFASVQPIARTLPRFLVVVAVGLGLNTLVLTVGTEVLDAGYVLVQLVALALIPLSNYLLNSLWTFR